VSSRFVEDMDASTSTPATDRPRSTRDRPAKKPLSEEAIVDAALAITKAEGLDAVTMRRVAAELDTGAASLYVYLKNRDELLRAMVDRALGATPLVEPDPEHWRQQVHDLLRNFLETLEAYPGMAAAFPAEPPSTPNALAGAEALMAILLAGGIPTQEAAWALDILSLIVTATAAETDVRRAAGRVMESEDDALVMQVRENLAGLPADRFPNLHRHAVELTTGAGEDRFRFAIDTFLDGLVARSSR
jgi:AcrR family transcriptional regulator